MHLARARTFLVALMVSAATACTSTRSPVPSRPSPTVAVTPTRATASAAATASESPSPNVGSPTPGSAAQALADRLLTTADRPQGWTTSPSHPDLSYGPPNDQQNATCFGYPYVPVIQRAYGPDFISPDHTVVSVEVDQSDPHAWDVEAPRERNPDRQARCLKANLESPFSRNAFGLDGLTSTVSTFPAPNGIIGLSAVVRGSTSGRTVTLYLAEATAEIKPYTIGISFFAERPIDTTSRDRLIAIVAARAQTA